MVLLQNIYEMYQARMILDHGKADFFEEEESNVTAYLPGAQNRFMQRCPTINVKFEV